MAVFNPEVPVTKDPDWKKDFRPISDIPADKTAGMALSLLGNTIEGVTGLVKTGIETSLKDEAYTKADIAQKIDQNFLEGQRAELTGEKLPTNKVVALDPSIKPNPSLLNNNEEDPAEKPQGLTAGVSQVNRLGSAARSNPGLNTTWYTMMADSTAKELRAKFPGFREYIDQVTSQAFGVNVANAYRNDLRQDVNHLMTQLNSGKDTELVEFRKRSDIPGFTGLYNQLEQNPNNMELRYKMRSIVNTYDAAKAKNANKLTELQVKAAEGKATADDYYQTISSSIATASEFNFTNSLKTIGLDNPDILNQPDNIKAAKMSEFGTRLAVERHQANLDLENRLNMKLPDGRVLRSVLGETYVKNIRDDQNYRYDSLMTLLNGNKPENFAAVYHTANMFKATVDDEARSLQKHPVIGLPATRLSAMNKLLDPQLTAALGLDIFVKNALGTDMGNWLVGEKLAAATNSGRPAGTAGGAPNETKRIADTIKVLKNELRINPDTGIYEELFKTLNIMTDPKATVENKKNIVDYFVAANQDSTYLKYFGFDKEKLGMGKGLITGRNAAFALFASPKVAKAVAEIPDPAYQEKYLRTLNTMFAGDIVRDDIHNLNSLDDTRLRVVWNGGKDGTRPVGFSLEDTMTKKLYTPTWMTDSEKRTIARDSAGSTIYADSMYRINQSLNTYVKALQQLGDKRDTSDIMLDVMINQLGFKPNAHTIGLPNEMTRAIIGAKLKEEEGKSVDKKVFDTIRNEPPVQTLNFGPEDKPLTLGGWLSGLNSLRENVKPPAGPIITPAQPAPQQPVAQDLPDDLINNPTFDRYDPKTGRTYMRNGLTQDQINKMKDAENRAKRNGSVSAPQFSSIRELIEDGERLTENIEGLESYQDWRRTDNVEDRRLNTPPTLTGKEKFGEYNLEDNPESNYPASKSGLAREAGIEDILLDMTPKQKKDLEDKIMADLKDKGFDIKEMNLRLDRLKPIASELEMDMPKRKNKRK